MGEFVTVAKSSDVAEGDLMSVEASDKTIALANVGGTIYAFDDTCTHQQCSLSEGDLSGTTLTCYCHGSQFDITTGAVVGPPATEPVPTYPVRIEGEDVQVEV
jgi:3-phenylpropionate/trans-cinnamate dioxygenase ferredoxin subunit